MNQIGDVGACIIASNLVNLKKMYLGTPVVIHRWKQTKRRRRACDFEYVIPTNPLLM